MDYKREYSIGGCEQVACHVAENNIEAAKRKNRARINGMRKAVVEQYASHYYRRRQRNEI